MPLVPIDEVHLNTLVAGSGPPLLFVHGFPLDHSMWREQIPFFARTHTVIAPDLRGFGRSDVTTGTVSMARFADDLAELLIEIGVTEPVAFCGLSMGGYIAFEFARRHGPKLSHLVLCDTRVAADALEARTKRFETADRVTREGPGFLADSMPERLYAKATFERQPELIAATQEVIRRSPRGGVAAASRGMGERADATPWLTSIQTPTLVVCGAHDAIAPPAEMREFAGKIPGAQFVQIADAGHMAPEEQPAAFNAALARYLQS
jgi:3-oxoadipate enol-lactonase